MFSLTYIDEMPERSIFLLTNGQMIIGRETGSDVHLNEEFISSVHLSIRLENNSYVLRDHSVNGSYVNGERVTHCVLKQNDMLRVGQYLFLVNVMADSNPVVHVSPVPIPKPQIKTPTVVQRVKPASPLFIKGDLVLKN